MGKFLCWFGIHKRVAVNAYWYRDISGLYRIHPWYCSRCKHEDEEIGFW